MDVRSVERDFFISYRSIDQRYAEWIAWELEAAGYTTFVQAWDFRPGQNFVHQMQQGTSSCCQTIAVLTPAYFESGFTRAEWYSAFARDPTGKERPLIPVRMEECAQTGDPSDTGIPVDEDCVRHDQGFRDHAHDPTPPLHPD